MAEFSERFLTWITDARLESQTKRYYSNGWGMLKTTARENHPEAKSLGPDGKACTAATRGLFQRAHIVAKWPPTNTGKESDKHWEEGENLSLLEFKTIEDKRKGYAIAIEEQLRSIAQVPKREFIRRGINRNRGAYRLRWIMTVLVSKLK